MYTGMVQDHPARANAPSGTHLAATPLVPKKPHIAKMLRSAAEVFRDASAALWHCTAQRIRAQPESHL